MRSREYGKGCFVYVALQLDRNESSTGPEMLNPCSGCSIEGAQKACSSDLDAIKLKMMAKQ